MSNSRETISPQEADTLEAAYTFLKKDNASAAVEALTHFVSTQGGSWRIKLLLASAYRKLGNFDSALAEVIKLLDFAPAEREAKKELERIRAEINRSHNHSKKQSPSKPLEANKQPQKTHHQQHDSLTPIVFKMSRKILRAFFFLPFPRLFSFSLAPPTWVIIGLLLPLWPLIVALLFLYPGLPSDIIGEGNRNMLFYFVVCLFALLNFIVRLWAMAWRSWQQRVFCYIDFGDRVEIESVVGFGRKIDFCFLHEITDVKCEQNAIESWLGLAGFKLETDRGTYSCFGIAGPDRMTGYARELRERALNARLSAKGILV